tara:strand:+ start:1568 stop:1903 length:336 start_codon:yes stop_codon:yes gene_type:complete
VSDLEDTLAMYLDALHIGYQREVRFAAPRRWRFDFLFADQVACEVDGGIYSGGRHTRGAGYEKDAEKFNEAAILGFTVLHVTSTMIASGAAVDYIERALAARAKRPQRGTK